jgi:hypothetical protein
MPFPTVAIDVFVRPAGAAGVYVAAADDIAAIGGRMTIGGRRVTAVAPHPRIDDLVYLTIGHPESLAFLEDDYVEVD